MRNRWSRGLKAQWGHRRPDVTRGKPTGENIFRENGAFPFSIWPPYLSNQSEHCSVGFCQLMSVL